MNSLAETVVPADAAAGRWTDAALAAALFCVDPPGTGGVSLRALPGPVRDQWLALLRECLPVTASLRRVPLQVADGRLLGGLDLAATLQAGRPVAERGLLVEADGGVVLLAMAERLSNAAAARLTAVLDTGAVTLERDGLAASTPTRFGVVALDESMDDDEAPPPALRDRLAFAVDLAGITVEHALALAPDPDGVAAARRLLPGVVVGDATTAALCEVALALGVGSLRASLLAVRVARAAAAFAGRTLTNEADARVAGRLVLAPRATRLPPAGPDEDEGAEPDPPEAADAQGEETERDDDALPNADRPLEDRVLDATRSAIPPGLLAALQSGDAGRTRSTGAGRAGAMQAAKLRGRPAGTRRGEPRAGARLHVVDTLRAAAPWQRLRRRDGTGPWRIEVRRDDFHVARYKRRSPTTTIFVVDASGSSALNRLAEAKGAVELLLADCYVRRDQVALLAFRGRSAELLLPPTRSLVRATRSLARLPGGGGTPLALAIDGATALAEVVRRRGETPVVVLLTDGRANIARDGSPGRPRAEDDALAAAGTLRAAGFTCLLVDTSPQPHPQAKALAAAMGARYLPLPYADASAISTSIRAATTG